jgi:hypothetical protein
LSQLELADWRATGSGPNGTYVFITPRVPHNIANASDKPAKMIMTVSPPGHEHQCEFQQPARELRALVGCVEQVFQTEPAAKGIPLCFQ